MPTVDIQETITKIRANIEMINQESFRLQGVLSTFEGFKNGGLTTIELPQDPAIQPEVATDEDEDAEAEQLESTQEKPE